MESSAARAAGALALTLLACLAGGGGLWARGQLHSVAAANPAPQIKAQVATPGRAIGYVEDFEQTPGSMLHVRGLDAQSRRDRGASRSWSTAAPRRCCPTGPETGRARRASRVARGFERGVRGAGGAAVLDRRIGSVEVVAVDRKGQKTILQRQVLFPDDYKSRWSSYLPERGVAPDEVFYFPIATSHVGEGGGRHP